MSLQSGCDATLHRMNRRYDTARFRQSVDLLRQYFDHPAITTDVICGFPQETEEEFSATLAFLEECRFAAMHVFPYSIRPGTKAADMPQVPGPVKEERAARAGALAARLHRAYLEECVGRVETLSAGRVENYTNRLYEKLKVILEDRNIDDARVLTEAAIFGDKTAVDEETVRLRSHIAQYRSILELDEPVGRKLDFLTQELNRETNTIGSKCQDLDITRIVVDMKAEIEKIREQIQNLE